MGSARSQQLVQAMDACHVRVCLAERDLLRLIAEADGAEVWRGDGARDMAHWLRIRYGISDWKARRWIASAHALDGLPAVASAMASGELGIDKVVELTRFARPEDEGDLVGWAASVPPGAIRHRGDVEAKRPAAEAAVVDADRRIDYWFFDEDRRFGLQLESSAADGARIVRALEREAERIPVMPGEHPRFDRPARLADALVSLASRRLADDGDPDRATVIVHAPIEVLSQRSSESAGCEIAGGGVAHVEVARRLACTGRLQAVIEDSRGDVVRLGRLHRDPPAWMLRQLARRDRGCVFPGCGSRRFANAHHIDWWGRGGTTDLSNLALVCTWHHKLVHEYGWSMRRVSDGTVRWYRPDGRRFRPGPRFPAAPGADGARASPAA